MGEKIIRAAAVQFNHKASDKDYNFSRIAYFVAQAAQKSVQLIAFPEMCITGYWHVPGLSKQELESLAESIPQGTSSQKLLELSKKYNIIIGAGLLEQSEGKLYNTYAVALPDGQLKTHRKLHAFESKYISSGNEHTVFETALGVKLGVLICYDNNLPENCRIVALKGADILLAPHQTGGTASLTAGGMRLIDVELWENREQNPEAIEREFKGPSGREWLLKWLPTRAWDNGYFIIFSNGVGADNGEVRTGNAMLIDPAGEIVIETWKARDEMVIADLELEKLSNCNGRRKLRARRPELYSLLTQPTGKEVDAITARFTTENP
jgi:predicted amidohydrolase